MTDAATVGLMAAFAAGIVSFLSPCVLPLVPAYVSFVAGQNFQRRRNLHARERLAALGMSGFFVLGFSTVFIAFGASASALGQLLQRYRYEANLVAGVIVIIFGLLMLGMSRFLPWLQRDLRGEVSIVNVFASWCVACRDEHPLWMALARQNIAPIHGLNYKDKPDDAARWLGELGDPYRRTGADLDGRVGIEWGVYGVPETYVVDKRGVIRDKVIGAITPRIVDERLLPLVRRLQAE